MCLFFEVCYQLFCIRVFDTFVQIFAVFKSFFRVVNVFESGFWFDDILFVFANGCRAIECCSPVNFNVRGVMTGVRGKFVEYASTGDCSSIHKGAGGEHVVDVGSACVIVVGAGVGAEVDMWVQFIQYV